MTEQESPTPQQPDVRIGDDERTAVCEQLQAHFAAGRLDSIELDERLDRAVTARWAGDLHALLADLPELPPPPALTPIPAAPSPDSRRWTRTVDGAIGGAVMLAVFAITGMLLGSIAFGLHITFFALVGGSLAVFVGGGVVWLSDREQLRAWGPRLPPPPGR